MRYRVLGEERRLQANFRADPLSLSMRGGCSVIAQPARSKLRAKVGTLHFIVVIEIPECLVTHSAGDIDF